MHPTALSGAHGLYCSLTIGSLWVHRVFELKPAHINHSHRFVVPSFCLFVLVIILGFEGTSFDLVME
jgi:hypothetical protein